MCIYNTNILSLLPKNIDFLRERHEKILEAKMKNNKNLEFLEL